MTMMYIYVDACCDFVTYPDASTYICFSSSVPTISPYFTYQRRVSGSHFPPTALTFLRNSVSYPAIRTATIVSAESFCGGGSQSVRSITSSTVLRRCRDAASYLNRTHTSLSPYLSVSFLVPRWPGFRMSRVFTSNPVIKNMSNYTQFLISCKLKSY